MYKKLLGMLVVVVLMLALFTIPASADLNDLTTINPALMVTAAEAQAWHEFKATVGPTDSGGPGWHAYVDFLYDKLEEYGAVDFIENHWTYNLHTVNDWPIHDGPLELTVDNNGVAVDIPVASYTNNSGSTLDMPGGVLTAPMVYYDSTLGAPAAGVWAGKIVVLKTRPQPPEKPYTQSYLDNYAVTDYEYRTDGDTFPEMFEYVSPTINNSFNTRYQFTEETTLRNWAITGQAAGMVIVSDLPWDTAVGLHQRTDEYDIPSLFLDVVNGATAISHAQAGRTASLKLFSEWIPVDTYNTICFLPGKYYGTSQDEYIVLDTHTDSMALTQDNGALGVLGTLKYFSQIPQSERPRTLLLYIDNRHFMTGGESRWDAQDLLKIHPELVAKSFVQVGYEHMGQLEAAERDGHKVATGLPEFSYIGTVSNDWLIDKAIKAIQDNQLPRADLKDSYRPGVNGGYQMSVKTVSMYFRSNFSKPYIGLAGNWPGAHTQVSSGIEWFDAALFVKQVATMTQIVGELMALEDPLVVDLVWGNLQDAIRNLAATAVDSDDKTALLEQCDVIFEDVVNGQYISAANKLQVLMTNVQSLVADGTAKNNILNYINRAIGLLDISPTVSLGGDAFLTGGEVARYTVSVKGVPNLNTATVWFEAQSPYLTGKEFNGLNGFGLLGPVQWTQNGNVWAGRATIVNTESGVTANKPLDICEILFNTSQDHLGATEVKLTKVQLSGINEAGVAVFIDATVTNDVVQTEIEKEHDKYDVNRDGKVDQLDISTALLFYMAEEGDANWAVSKRADVNGDGRVDTADLILILNNIVW